MERSFWKAGHTPTLFSAFLYFDLSFMVWVLLGPLAVQIAADLQLSPAQKGLMVATPVLAGALLRVVMGVLVDHLQPKKAGLIGQFIVMAALGAGAQRVFAPGYVHEVVNDALEPAVSLHVYYPGLTEMPMHTACTAPAHYGEVDAVTA